MTSTTSRRVALTLRAVTAAALALLLWFGVRDDTVSAREIRVTSDTDPALLAGELAAVRPGRLVFHDSMPPTRAVTTLMSAAPQLGRSLTLTLPDRSPTLRINPPPTPRALRRAALGIRVKGESNTTLRLTMEDDAGASDSVDVSIGPDGTGAVSMGIEVARPGVARWTVRSPDTGVGGVATTWVRPAESLSVLVHTTTPDWETRYLIRALEGAGARVTVRQTLGSTLEVTTSGTPLLSDIDDLDPFDVVVSTTATADDPLLRRFMVERGGGVLLLNRTGEGRIRGDADGLRWTAPAEWLPLPALGIEVEASPLPLPTSGTARTAVVARLPGSDRAVVTAAVEGRGRLVVSGLDSWSWLLAGGARQAHTEYWTSVLEWLAGGMRADVRLDGPVTQPYEVWRGRLEAGGGGEAGSGGEAGGGGEGSASRVLRFVPTEAGATPILLDAGDTIGAAIAAPGDERLDWVTAAAAMGAAGATLLDPSTASISPTRTLDDPRRLDWPLFLALALAMATGWSVRRLRGLS